MPVKLKKTNIQYDVETPADGYIILGFDELGNLVYKDDSGNYERVVPVVSTGQYIQLETEYLTVGYRLPGSSLGTYSIAQGLNVTASGESSLASGNFTYATEKNSQAHGQYVSSTNVLSYVYGQGATKEKLLVSGGVNSFIHSYVGDSNSHGTLADYSFILGGRNNDIGSGSTDSGIIGGLNVNIGVDINNTTAISCRDIILSDENIKDTVVVPSMLLTPDSRSNSDGMGGMIRWSGSKLQSHNGSVWEDLSGGASVENPAATRILTSTSTGGINAEENFTFNGSSLILTGNFTISDYLKLTNLPNSATTSVVYFDTTTKTLSYGAAPSGGSSSGTNGVVQLSDGSGGFTHTTSLAYYNNYLYIGVDDSSTTSNRIIIEGGYNSNVGDGGDVSIKGGDAHNTVTGGHVYIDGGESFQMGDVYINRDHVTHAGDGGKLLISSSGSVYSDSAVEIGGNTYADDFIITSDRRLKEDIKPIENALEKIMNTEGVYYKLTKDKNKIQKVGVIAQQIQEHIPEVVSGEDSLAVSYGNITAVLIEAMKEQQSKINSLEKILKDNNLL